MHWIVNLIFVLLLAAGVIYFVGTRDKGGFTSWKVGLAAWLPALLIQAIELFDKLRHLG